MIFMKNIFLKYQKSLYFTLAVCALVAIVLVGFLGDVIAQPGLPSDPEQTPIDGGLGILAAFGGTYAIKKLREKKDV